MLQTPDVTGGHTSVKANPTMMRPINAVVMANAMEYRIANKNSEAVQRFRTQTTRPTKTSNATSALI